MSNKIQIYTCQTSADFEIAKVITNDYMKWLGMDLSFQSTDKEFQIFDKMYGTPEGCFIYAKVGDRIAGGVGTRKIGKDICEMKRLFVYNEFQGKGIGKLLSDKIIDISAQMGYSKMRLDTIERLEKAISLYEKSGFYEIPAYYPNPDPTVKYFELALK